MKMLFLPASLDISLDLLRSCLDSLDVLLALFPSSTIVGRPEVFEPDLAEHVRDADLEVLAPRGTTSNTKSHFEFLLQGV